LTLFDRILAAQPAPGDRPFPTAHRPPPTARYLKLPKSCGFLAASMVISSMVFSDPPIASTYPTPLGDAA